MLHKHTYAHILTYTRHTGAGILLPSRRGGDYFKTYRKATMLKITAQWGKTKICPSAPIQCSVGSKKTGGSIYNTRAHIHPNTCAHTPVNPFTHTHEVRKTSARPPPYNASCIRPTQFAGVTHTPMHAYTIYLKNPSIHPTIHACTHTLRFAVHNICLL